MYLLQVGDIKELLSTETVGVIGLLLAVCGLLIWDKVREQDRYKDLYTKYEHEQEENKKLLIDLVTKSILATEKNTQAIDAIRDAIHRK
jgi:hypothetical protein